MTFLGAAPRVGANPSSGRELPAGPAKVFRSRGYGRFGLAREVTTMTSQDDSTPSSRPPAVPERRPAEKAPKPPKPRKVEKRRRGRKG